MKPDTIRRSLEKWEPWQDSLNQARKKCNFRPDFSPEDYGQWVISVGWESVVREALTSLHRLSLPWFFCDYWLSSFWGECIAVSWSSDGEKPWMEDYMEIVRQEVIKPYYAGITLSYSKRVHKGGSLPWPFILSVNFPYAVKKGDNTLLGYIWGKQEYKDKGQTKVRKGLFRKGQGEEWSYLSYQFVAPQGCITRIHLPDERSSQMAIPMSVRVEMPLFLATDDVLRAAFDQIRYFRNASEQLRRHPLNQIARRDRLHDDTDAENRKALISQEIMAFNEGRCSFTEILKAEFKRDILIQKTIGELERLYDKKDCRYKERVQREAHKVYIRVYGWFAKRKINPGKAERGWWWKELKTN